MAEEILIIPPIRQSLEDLNSAKDNELDPPKTEKSWYLYWQQTGDRVNANTDKLNKLVTYGNHADRPPADTMPAGSLYVETDRGNVIYQNVDGAWKYLAGTMFGTLSPDQRPTDLGVDDAGFDFRATDVAREFLWSQTEWIEATAVQYGIHSGRPNPATITEGSLYVETDRGGVIYQNQAGVWRYLAGTMYGTLSPDQRPTDLGANDGGFDFRGTDQEREFIWSQTVWIEVTGMVDPTTTKGDLIARGATAITRLGVGTDNWVLTADSTQPLGMRWASVASGGGVVSSVFGRTGTVIAVSGDYSASMVSNAVDATLFYVNPSWIQSLAYAKITGAPAVYWTGGIGGAIYYNGGNVGIGTTNPAKPLDVNGVITVQDGGARALPGGIATEVNSNIIDFGLNDDSTSRFGTYVQGSQGGMLRFDGRGGAPVATLFVRPAGSATGVSAITVLSNGNIGLGGQTSPTYRLQVDIDSAAKPSTNTWAVASDIRTKRNVHSFDGDIDLIRKLQPIAAEYNGLGGTPEGARVVSFDAAQLREILPQAVSSTRGKLRSEDAEETDLLSVNTHEIFYHMLRAIQHLDAEINALKQKQ